MIGAGYGIAHRRLLLVLVVLAPACSGRSDAKPPAEAPAPPAVSVEAVAPSPPASPAAASTTDAGTGVPPDELDVPPDDHRSAEEMEEAACQAGDAKACVLLAGQHRDRDNEQWAKYLQLACDHGGLRACGHLADALDPDQPSAGLAKDRGRAVALYEKSCRTENEQSGRFYAHCPMVAEAYDTGQGVPKDRKRATELFDLGCADGRAILPACVTVAKRYEQGVGTPKDLARAALRYAWVCRSGGPWVISFCKKAAALYRGGRGVKPNPAVVKEMQAMVCAQQGGCTSSP